MPGGRTQFAVLSVLRLGPASGSEIRAFCQTRLASFWSESYGQIYPALEQLRRGGLIRKVAARATSGRNVRYAITEAGHAALRDWLAAPTAARTVRDEMLLKLVCGTEAGGGDHVARIEQARDRAAEELKNVRAARKQMKVVARGVPDMTYWLLILRAGELAYEARLRWCREALDLITADTSKDERKP